ncbi:MAG: HDOD domain-containing protein [Phycisphaerae bacterium]|nr:HDOD domain-containing protein [Phycisphaerae bacterium]
MPLTLEPNSNGFIESVLSESPDIGTMPEVTVKIIDIVENPQSRMKDLHKVISNDPALSTKILKVVNSALYGLPTSIGNIDRAIVLLGQSAVKNIAIATSMMNLFSAEDGAEGCSGKDVWRHSIGMAVATKLIYEHLNKPGADEGFLAGLIADIGFLIERQARPAEVAAAITQFKRDGGEFIAIERELIGADHQQFGWAVSKKWRFPDSVCTAIGWHHSPASITASDPTLALAVRAADVLTCRLQLGFCMMFEDEPIGLEVTQRLGLTEPMIQKILKEMPKQVATAEAIFES